MESIIVEIIARLPLRSIARFKSVCKQWRSLIESQYFRSLFVSLHRNSSSSWSLMFYRSITEAIGFYGCERWALPKSLASYIIPSNLHIRSYSYINSSHGLVWIEVFVNIDSKIKDQSLVGNPNLQEWVEIPPPPVHGTIPISLVTRLVNGAVSSFKVVRRTYLWKMYVYSCETGTWTSKTLHSSSPLQRSCFLRPLEAQRDALYVPQETDWMMMMILALEFLYLMTFMVKKTMISAMLYLSLSSFGSYI